MGLRRGRLTVAAVSVLLAGVLAGCSGLRPGTAAVVGDETISDQQFRETTSKFCTFLQAFQAAQGQPPEIPARIAALVSLDYLLRGEAAEQLAEREGIEIDPQELKQYAGAIGVPAEAAPDGREQDVRDITQLIARTSFLIDKLGADAEGNQTAAGNERVMEYLNEVGYETEGRYGDPFAGQREQQPGTGSLSVPLSQEALDGQGIPQAGNVEESQLCS